MALLSQIYLVSPDDGIEGSKLPSGKQVLRYFLYLKKVLKEDIRKATLRPTLLTESRIFGC